jgi:hypothetical protein
MKMDATLASVICAVALVIGATVSFINYISSTRASLVFAADGQHSITLDATKRVILTSNRGGPNRDKVVVCAEPSPDAMTALTAQMPVASTTSAATEALAKLQETAQQLGSRNATIQLLRDATYRACEAYLNGAIDEFEYSVILNHFDRIMVSLLGIEDILQTGSDRAPTEVRQQIMSYISELSKEPRLIVSCFSWFARNAQVKLEPNNEISKYCGGALKAYEVYAMRGAQMRTAGSGEPPADLDMGNGTAAAP